MSYRPGPQRLSDEEINEQTFNDCLTESSSCYHQGTHSHRDPNIPNLWLHCALLEITLFHTGPVFSLMTSATAFI